MNSFRTYLSGGILSAVLLILSNSLLAAQEKYDVSLIPDSLKSGALAVVRYDKTQVAFENNELEIFYERAITIFSKRAESLLDFSANYKEGSEKIKDIRVYVYDKDGYLLQEFGKKQIQDLVAKQGFEMITDQRQKYVDLTLVDLPLTVHYTYTKETKNTVQIPSWTPVPAYGVSVEQSHYLLGNRDFEILKLEKNFDSSIKRSSDRHYSCTGFKRIRFEAQAPGIRSVLPHVIFNPSKFQFEGYKGGFTNWKEYGTWKYTNFLSDRNDFDAQSVKNELDKLMTSSMSKIERIKVIYDYLQEETRYIYIGLDEGGYRPMTTAEVHENKYGDCKALSFYTKAMLDLYGIESNYTEIFAEESKSSMHDTEFASLGQGNHIILNVPTEEDTIWLECTSKILPFNFLGDFTDDRRAILIKESGGEVVRTPVYNEHLNLTENIIDLAVSPDGSVALQMLLRNRGIPMSDKLSLNGVVSSVWEKYIKNNLLHALNKIDIIEKEIEFNEEEWTSLETYKINAEDYAEIAGKYLLLPVDLIPFKIPSFKKLKRRKLPLEILRSEKRVSTQNIVLPEGFSLYDTFEKIDIQSDYASFSLDVKNIDKNSISIIKEFIIKKGIYPPGKYNDIRSVFNKIEAANKSQITVHYE